MRDCEDWIPDLKLSIDELQTSFSNKLFHHFIFENDSSDDTKAMIKKHFSYYTTQDYNHADDKYMKSRRMAYYRNRAKKYLLKNFKGFDSHFKYIILLDSGVDISSKILEPLFRVLDENPDIAMTCPIPSKNAVVSDINGVRRIPEFTDCFTYVSVCFDGISVVRTNAFVQSTWSVNHHCDSEYTNFCWGVSEVGKIVIVN